MFKHSLHFTAHQSGFTLIELMIAIAVIAILTAIGLPTYQGYVQKAAMTDMLQTMSHYKSAVEICAFEQGRLSACHSGSNGIADTKTTNYVASIKVASGLITIIGRNTLSGLTVVLTPTINTTNGDISWSKNCQTNPLNNGLTQACNDVFRF